MVRKRKNNQTKGRLLFRLVMVLILAGVGWLNRDIIGAAPRGSNTSAQEEGAFTVYSEVSLVSSKYNDGDSFLVKHGGETQEYRLYFVDAPESRDKPYEDFRQRVREQGEALGGLTYKETLAVGARAKAFTNERLKAGHFQVYTTGELVYGGPRRYAFVKVSYNGERLWLHELLVKKGLARIHTWGTDLPNGTAWRSQKKALYALQKSAQRSREGAWGERRRR